MYSEWKVKLRDAIGQIGQNVIIYAERGEKIEVYNPITRVVQTIDRFATIDPAEYEMYLEPEMLQGLFDTLQRNGFKPSSQSKIEGLYEAQSAHLRDMRMLLKLPMIVENMEIKKENHV